MSEELKPCPFCGCEVEKSITFGIRHRYVTCVLQGQTFPVDKWSTRAYESELASLREENERLRSANPWRYPLRGELPDYWKDDPNRLCEVTSLQGTVNVCYAYLIAKFPNSIRAWREYEPAPKLEDE